MCIRDSALPVIASNRDFVKEIITPSAYFNPLSEESILQSLISSRKLLDIKGELKVKSYLNKIINHLLE